MSEIGVGQGERALGKAGVEFEGPVAGEGQMVPVGARAQHPQNTVDEQTVVHTFMAAIVIAATVLFWL